MKILRNAKSPKAQYYKFFKSGPIGTSSMGSSPSQRAAWSMNQSVPTASRHCCRQGDAFAMFSCLDTMLPFYAMILDYALTYFHAWAFFTLPGHCEAPVYISMYILYFLHFSQILTRLTSLDSTHPFQNCCPCATYKKHCQRHYGPRRWLL